MDLGAKELEDWLERYRGESENFRVVIRRGLIWCYASQERYSDALAVAEEALRLTPQFDEQLLTLMASQIYERQGKWKEAEDIYKGLLSKYPKLREQRFRMGLCQQRQGKSEQAVAALSAYVDQILELRGLKPPHLQGFEYDQAAQACYTIGQIREKQGRTREAGEAYAKTVREFAQTSKEWAPKAKKRLAELWPDETTD